jgi:hypothetical protein
MGVSYHNIGKGWDVCKTKNTFPRKNLREKMWCLSKSETYALAPSRMNGGDGL